jgi:hypothetical protein
MSSMFVCRVAAVIYCLLWPVAARAQANIVADMTYKLPVTRSGGWVTDEARGTVASGVNLAPSTGVNVELRVDAEIILPPPNPQSPYSPPSLQITIAFTRTDGSYYNTGGGGATTMTLGGDNIHSGPFMDGFGVPGSLYITGTLTASQLYVDGASPGRITSVQGSFTTPPPGQFPDSATYRVEFVLTARAAPNTEPPPMIVTPPPPPPLPPATPEELLNDLVASILVVNIKSSLMNSLDAKLDRAVAALDDYNRHDHVATIQALQAFINEVEAQSGKAIPAPADADVLIGKAQRIIALLGG